MVRRINLVPETQRRRTRTDLGLLGVAVATVAVLGGMGVAYLHFSGEAADREAELALLQTQRQQIEAQLAALGQFESLQTQVQASEALVQQIYGGRMLVSEVLGDLSLVVPKEVWLSNMDLSAPPLAAANPAAAAASGAPVPAATGNVSMSGTTFTFEDVAELLVRLDQVAMVSRVTLGSANSADIGERDVKNFDVTLELRNTRPAGLALPITEVEVKG